MPVVGEFHRKYWRARTNTPIPPGVSNTWSYPAWQRTSIAVGSLFGGLQEWAARLWAELQWCYRVVQQVRALDQEQRVVLGRVIATLNHPRWPETQMWVRECATTPKFHRPENWVEYGRALKADAGQAQNVFRHVKIVHALRKHRDMTNPDAHLLAELAYQGMAFKDRH